MFAQSLRNDCPESIITPSISRCCTLHSESKNWNLLQPLLKWLFRSMVEGRVEYLNEDYLFNCNLSLEVEHVIYDLKKYIRVAHSILVYILLPVTIIFGTLGMLIYCGKIIGHFWYIDLADISIYKNILITTCANAWDNCDGVVRKFHHDLNINK